MQKTKGWVEGEEEAGQIIKRIREYGLRGANIEKISVNRFQCTDKSGAIVWSSGVVESYYIKREEYPRVWLQIVTELFEEKIEGDWRYEAFVNKE